MVKPRRAVHFETPNAAGTASMAAVYGSVGNKLCPEEPGSAFTQDSISSWDAFRSMAVSMMRDSGGWMVQREDEVFCEGLSIVEAS